MQFVKDGPNIPERLLQAHEDGRVVFFCGAGISYPAGLPGFEGLVERLRQQVGEPLDSTEEAWFAGKEFDRTIGHYESRIQGGRQYVRQHLPRILSPDLNRPRALTTHHALLTLARRGPHAMRIVTTNFDTLFEAAREKCKLADFPVHPEPPVRSHWSGLVYLHGRMPRQASPDDLDRLILSDVDFGKAYLTEAWAARFLANLFRDNVICFVGYRVEDPVLRYMTAAHAANDGAIEMFAFAEFADDADKTLQAKAWDAKHVTPILYHWIQGHRNLHRSLQVWAAMDRDDERGRERLVARYAHRDPRTSNSRNDFVGRVLWALRDLSGLPARRFADLNPVPSLEWLEALNEPRFGRADPGQFGVPPVPAVNDEVKFSLMSRPAPYRLAPSMAVVDAGFRRSGLDPVQWELTKWMTRHLDDPALILWLAKNGGQLHGSLVWRIERRLDELATLQREGNLDELERIRSNAPAAIPGPLMQTLWRLMLSGRVAEPVGDASLYDWHGGFKRDGLTVASRLQLCDLLAPRVLLRPPFSFPTEVSDGGPPERVNDLVEWEIVLSVDDAHVVMDELSTDQRWNAALPTLLVDFTGLLRDALDLMRESGRADDRSDLSNLHQPSIAPHPQNTTSHGWTVLIDLVRQAWLATAAQSSARAVRAAESWWDMPYPLFRRLAFFAATQDGVIPIRLALDWLLADERRWLWSAETKREAARLMVALAPKLDEAMSEELEQAILTGPPRAMYRADIEPQRWADIVDQEVWQRLAKIEQAGGFLGPAGQERLNTLSSQHPEWKLSEDQREEFRYWTGSGDEFTKFVAAPRHRAELVEWLREYPTKDFWHEDDWRERCRANFSTTACALYTLTRDENWPIDRWREALHAWSVEELHKRSWRYMAPVLASAPDDAFLALARQISYWLQEIASTFVGHEAVFFTLADRLLALHAEDGVSLDDPVTRAINHPVGHVTQALLRWWQRQRLEGGQGLPAQLQPRFTALCDTGIDRYRHGRVLLASYVITLFRVDPDWTAAFLLPLFDWQRSQIEARSVWQGFLRSRRLSAPLLRVLKPAFLDTAQHYAELEASGEQYADALTWAALETREVFTTDELAEATRALPTAGLNWAATALVRRLRSAGGERPAFWANRAVPYLRTVWPWTRDKQSPDVVATLSRVCVAAQDAFPEAVELLRAWLQPQRRPFTPLRELRDAGLCNQFPESALEFLSLVIGAQTRWLPSDLEACLEAIHKAQPALAGDRRYMVLETFLRQRSPR